MNRTELINFLLRQRHGTRYLEIGVHDEQENFAHVQCAHKVGVDLRPVTTFHGPSDEFFAQNSAEFDLIFIDGLHTEEQVLKDIRHAERCLAAGGAVVLHDCMPPDAWHQRPPEEYHAGENWNGTVWKAALRVFNQTTHKCTLLDTDWGCGVIDTAATQLPVARALPAELRYEEHYPWLLEYKTSVAAYLRPHLRVFYHLACLGSWRAVLVEQLQQLGQHGFQALDLSVLGTDAELQEALALCAATGIEVNLLFHAPELTHFERPALLAIEAYARTHEGYVLYLHSKGVSDPANETKAQWRRLMMRALVERWESCLSQLGRYDVLGVNWRDMPPISHFCGNFWYASTAYLRTLADFQHYYDHPRYQIWDAINDRRLGCEFWISSARTPPRVCSLVCRNVDFCRRDFWQQQAAGSLVG